MSVCKSWLRGAGGGAEGEASGRFFACPVTVKKTKENNGNSQALPVITWRPWCVGY